MLKLKEIYKLCYEFEKDERKVAIKKLMKKGYSEENSKKYYNIWRKYYVTTVINIS